MQCGVMFEARIDTTKPAAFMRKLKSVSKKRTCSPECASLRREELRIKRTVCVVCGGAKNSGTSKTCSHGCSIQLKKRSMTGKIYNLCHYTAPDTFDYSNMLDILHRKGYVKAKDTKEKWTYTTTGFPSISWIDRVAREVVVSRKTSARKEQQGHEDGVQFQVEEIGAGAMSLKELRSSFKTRVTGAEGAMEE